VNYQLRMRIEIVQVDEHGAWTGQMGNLQVSEDIQFKAGSFLEIAHLLGQFHELSQQIKSNARTELPITER